MRLEGKVTVVTGAASGIGRGVARAFAAEGATLVLFDLDASGLEETNSQLGGAAELRIVDITDSHAIEKAFAETADRFGRLDVMIHSAALDQPVMKALEIDDELWGRIITTNVNGAFYANRAAIRAMGSGPGAIVNIVSDLGYVAVPGLAAYCTSKGAVLQLTRVLATEVAPRIRVNAVCPTMVNTPMGRRSLDSRPDPDVYLAEIASQIPMGRIAEVNDVVGAVVFLASDEATYITGTALPVDGGRTLV